MSEKSVKAAPKFVYNCVKCGQYCSKIEKVAAIGVRVRKWIAYHGFSININTNLQKYKTIIPCGIKDKGITNLNNIINQNYERLDNKIIENFISNLKILDV